MKKFRKVLLSSVLIFCMIFSLSACSLFKKGDKGNDGSGDAGQQPVNHEKEWTDASLTVFGDEYLAWKYDENADSYELYIDDEVIETTGFGYHDISSLDKGEHSFKVMKKIGEDNYNSEKMSYKKKSYTSKKVESNDELSEYESPNQMYQLGSMQYNKFVLDFSEVSSTSETLSSDLNVGSLLEVLVIKGNPSLTINNLRINVEEREKPLTIIFEEAKVSTSKALMIEYLGETEFEADIVVNGYCAFANTLTGLDGAKGNDASGLTSAGAGKHGNDGGSLFKLPKVDFFTQMTPSFITGRGGTGGNGGIGELLAHGGDGGNGGNGGSVFVSAKVNCFNLSSIEYNGSFGAGGNGGNGGSGISQGAKGKKGATGSIGSPDSTISYLSRIDGIITNPDGTINDDNVGFNISCVNNYLIWNEQTNAESYEVYVDGAMVFETENNCYYFENIEELKTKKIRIRTTYTEENKPVAENWSKVLKFYDDEEKAMVIEETKTSYTGAEHIIIDASLIGNNEYISIGADVQRFTIKNDSGSVKTLKIQIVAGSRLDNLILDLNNVEIIARDRNPAIMFNEGTGADSSIDPMLIINSYGSGVYGIKGDNGANGSDATGMFQQGGDGRNGQYGTDAIHSSLVVFMGDDFTAKGGNGGRGGNGGKGKGNNHGDGGNGGNGGIALKCTTCYIVMNSESSEVFLQTSQGGFGGDGYEGGLLTSGSDGTAGSDGAGLSGKFKKLVGSFVYNI